MSLLQKTNNVRLPKLLKATNGRSCINCGANDGTVVRAHYQGYRSNQYGKGRGIKGHDHISADLCARCHAAFDGHEEGAGDHQWLRKIDQSEQFLHLCVMTLTRDIHEGLLR